MENLANEVDNTLNLNENKVQVVEKIAAKDSDVVVKENEYEEAKVKDYYVQDAEEEVENKKFFGSEEFHDNMRRGLSVIEDLKDNSKKVLRKGHKKFDELSKSKIRIWLNSIVDTQKVGEIIREFRKTAKEEKGKVEDDEENKNQKFDTKQIYKKYPIEFYEYQTLFIYRTTKDDGTCSQISFNQSSNSWVICTKNESLMVKERKQIEGLAKSLNFIKAMGQVWFDYLDTLDGKLVEEIKEYFSDKTLLSELIGGVAKQQVKYGSKSAMMCFSVVENYSDDLCLAPPDAEKIFLKFKLPYRPIQKTVECSTYREFYKLFKEVSVEVNNSSLLEKGEGEVLYICGRPRSNPEKIEVIRMAKAKTIEYKLVKEGLKYIKQLHFVNNEVSQKIISDFQEIQPITATFAKSKVNTNYLVSVIRLMRNNKIEVTNENIKNFIKKEYGQEKLDILTQ